MFLGLHGINEYTNKLVSGMKHIGIKLCNFETEMGQISGQTNMLCDSKPEQYILDTINVIYLSKTYPLT